MKNYNEIYITKKNEVNKKENNVKEKQEVFIPSEKKEQERLRKLTGEYNLNNVDESKLKKLIKLENQTPEDYYRNNNNLSLNEEKKRINEAFGPKTDFSVWNFENNYDKMNLEEKEMLVSKMQSDLNSMGFRDKNGYRLKTDGKFGEKTNYAYTEYKNVNETKNNEIKSKTISDFEQSNKLNIAETKIGNTKEASADKNTKNANEDAYKYSNFVSDTKLSKKPEIKDRDKEVLDKEDYEKVQMYKAIYNYAKYELKDDAIAESAHREAVAIRQQNKYSQYEDYGPRRIKEFDSSLGLQYVGMEGYDDNYEYSGTKDTASIIISDPISLDVAEWESGRFPGHVSNANAISTENGGLNILAGIVDLVFSKTHPLYDKLHQGDIIVTVKRHKGNYKGATQKEYVFYFGKDYSGNGKNVLYHVKKR